MSKKWFQLSEQGAGEKRLLLSYWCYKLFGSTVLRIIAFFVALSVFITAKERRNASMKFYRLIKKPPFQSSLRQFINYGNALVDKFISYAGDLDPEKFILDNREIYNGTFFITTHIGNIEIMRSLIDKLKGRRVNIFLQANACKVFNDFLKHFETKVNADVFPVEEINLETSVLISERLKGGELVFMAGDRVSAQNSNKVYEADFLGEKIKLPLGTLKFALMLDCPIYFIVCAKEGKNYAVHTQEFLPKSKKRNENLERLKNEYSRFLEKYTLKYPYQFYHFYDITE